MSIRNLDRLFKPRAVALFGASKEKGTIGAVLSRNLLNSGFEGPVMPVNPRHAAIEGVFAYPDAAALPLVPDLAVIATPPASVPNLIGALAARGTRAAVVISAGFGERGDADGLALRQAMLDAARPHTLRIVGPNCLGVMVPAVGLNAGFAHTRAQPGRLAFVAQSGAIVTSVLDWASARGIGFTHFVSLGDMCDVDFGDMLDYLAGEGDVRGILLYIEAITNARKFMSAARAAARLKPVIVVKAGRYPATAKAVASHTGALAGQDAVYDAAFRRAGMLRVDDIGGLFGAVETLGMGPPGKGDRLTVLTNGGGLGIMALDALFAHGGSLAQLSPETMARLDAILPPTWSRGNPVDIIGDASAERYRKALAVLLEDPNADAILVLKCPTAVSAGDEVAAAVIHELKERRARVFTCWLGEEDARKPREMFGAARIPTYYTPERAVHAFMDLVDYRRNQEALTQTPPSVPEDFAPDVAAARATIDAALDAGRDWLTEPEAKAVLAAYGVPVVAPRIAASPQAAAAAAAALAGPVVLKILSPDITHKSDVGGVVLDLRAPAAVREAAEAMLERVGHALPQARIDGFTVQPMVERPDAFELLIGLTEDQDFGPVVLFGHGGTAAEVIADRAIALPPLNMHLARALMARTRVFKLLKGFRGRPAAALDDIALTLIKVAQMAIDSADIVELDINPLLADEFGVLALDARIRVRRSDVPPARRLAIRPYPKELEEAVSLADGRTFLLRPVVPEDEPAFVGLFAKLTQDDIRMRFFAPKRSLTHESAARMTQIDYDREMALVLAQPGRAGRTEIFGVVNISTDPDGERAEYAILIRSDMCGLGLGPLLMRRIIDYARQRGIREICGDVLRENKPMLKVCEFFNFRRTPKPDEPGLIEVCLVL
jgi:acetyltransferase